MAAQLVDSRLRRFRVHFLEQIDGAEGLRAAMRTMPDRESFVDLFLDGDRTRLRPTRTRQRLTANRYLSKLDTVSKKARQVANGFMYMASALTVGCLLTLCLLLRRIVDKNKVEVENQEKLVRQQAHVRVVRHSALTRSFCRRCGTSSRCELTRPSQRTSVAQPAIYFLQSILDTMAEGSPLTLDMLHTMRDDMNVALMCLRDVESQHNTRAFTRRVNARTTRTAGLDMYKVMQGKYMISPQLFGLRAFMDECLKSEEVIAKANRGRGGTDKSYVTSPSASHLPIDTRIVIATAQVSLQSAG